MFNKSLVILTLILLNLSCVNDSFIHSLENHPLPNFAKIDELNTIVVIYPLHHLDLMNHLQKGKLGIFFKDEMFKYADSFHRQKAHDFLLISRDKTTGAMNISTPLGNHWDVFAEAASRKWQKASSYVVLTGVRLSW